MSDIILKIENVSKQYQLGTYGTKTLSGDVHRWWTTKILGKEDPFLKVGVVNDRSSKEKAKFVWALKDINFEVNRGEVLGVIGKNGAGKSTLLKLLSRVTSPTIGSIKSAGRMASLLEVGTGFHPELTGLENIYLNGAILGMTKVEITRKLDEIIDFSGCALYIDTPVKRYSSGMKVRLGFAVAAFLDPEILVVDEVLAVGDSEFQKKAIGKMKDISSEEGRTILIVSHNLETINALCTKCLFMENGGIKGYGLTNQIIEDYISDGKNTKITNANYLHLKEQQNINIYFEKNTNKNAYIFNSFDCLKFAISNPFLRKGFLSVQFYNEFDESVVFFSQEIPEFDNFKLDVDNNFLPGNYKVIISFYDGFEHVVSKNAYKFSVIAPFYFKGKKNNHFVARYSINEFSQIN